MWVTILYAVLGEYDYLTQQRMRHFRFNPSDPWRSSDVWSEVMSGVDLIPVTSPSNDRMLWLQHNTTDRKFLEEVVWHGYWKDDDPCLHGIRRNAEAVYLPVSELLVKKGTIGNVDGVDIEANNFSSNQNEGFLTAWAGKDRRVPMHTMEGGDDIVQEGEAVPQISPEIGLISDITKTQEINYMNDNVHKNWWIAQRQNMQLKASMSATSMECVCYGYHDAFLLDAYETVWATQHEKGRMLVPYNGLWLINRIVSTYEAHSLEMHITLNREKFL